MLLTRTGAFAQVAQRWEFHCDNVDIAVELGAGAVRLLIDGAVSDEDVRLGPRQTTWLGASVRAGDSTRLLEAVVGDVAGVPACKVWFEGVPVGGELLARLQDLEPELWGRVRRRVGLQLFARNLFQPWVVLTSAVLGWLVAKVTHGAWSYGLAAALAWCVAFAAWLADDAWQRIDLPFQRRNSHLQGRRVLSEPVSGAARAVSNVRFALGTLLLLWAALTLVDSVSKRDSRRGAAVLLTGVAGGWLLRGVRRARTASLWPESAHSRREVLAEQRRHAEHLRELATVAKLAVMPPIEGVHYLPGSPRRRFRFEPGLSAETFASLLAWLMDQEIDFSLFDAAYPGTSSDPGAYLSYRPVEGVWHLTLGNHGWTGGIYRIDPSIVCLQLTDLYARGQLEELGVQDVHFFSHYDLVSAERNVQMNEKLRSIHGGH